MTGLSENASKDDAARMIRFDYKDIAEIEVKGKGVMKTYFL